MTIEDNSLVDTGGQLTFLAAIFLNVFKYFSVININTVLTMLVTLAGLIYMSLKIYNQILELRERKKRLKDGRERHSRKHSK
mgnify:CR=1 FL=1